MQVNGLINLPNHEILNLIPNSLARRALGAREGELGILETVSENQQATPEPSEPEVTADLCYSKAWREADIELQRARAASEHRGSLEKDVRDAQLAKLELDVAAREQELNQVLLRDDLDREAATDAFVVAEHKLNVAKARLEAVRQEQAEYLADAGDERGQGKLGKLGRRGRPKTLSGPSLEWVEKFVPRNASHRTKQNLEYAGRAAGALDYKGDAWPEPLRTNVLDFFLGAAGPNGRKKNDYRGRALVELGKVADRKGEDCARFVAKMTFEAFRGRNNRPSTRELEDYIKSFRLDVLELRKRPDPEIGLEQKIRKVIEEHRRMRPDLETDEICRVLQRVLVDQADG